MASISEIAAATPDTENPKERQQLPHVFYFGVFFDGTSNNMVDAQTAKQRRGSWWNKKWELDIRSGSNPIDDIKVGYSNIAVLHTIYKAMSEEEFEQLNQDHNVYRYNIYVEGAGTAAIHSKDSKVDKTKGAMGSLFGRGKTGVCHLVAKAVALVRDRLKFLTPEQLKDTEVHFDVFGFSRGATCARLFSYLVARYSFTYLNCELDGPAFMGSLAESYVENGFLHFLDNLGLKSATVDFLGIFDTVSSIGGFSVESYYNNTDDYGLWSPIIYNKILNTFHLCAMDEFRAHFGLTDIGKAAEYGNNAEVFIPGCHSDVGGGYVDDFYEFYLRTSLSLALDRIDREPGVVLPLNKSSLTALGWCDPITKVDYSGIGSLETITIKRYIAGGYGNIALEIMRQRALKILGRQLFDESELYKIPDNLKRWSDGIVNFAVNAKGRQWYYPEGNYSSPSYRKLRAHLHFSSKNFPGFEPGLEGRRLCRIVYSGNKGQTKPYFTTTAY